MNDLKDIIEEIKSRCDIVDIISDYMHLEKSGSNYTGLCPFHSEKTGSFMVSKSKQIYKCFGCNAGGDVISFVMRWENVDFMEAVKILARKCGITLDRNISEEEKKKIQEINKFREIHTEAARFYFANLLRTKNPGYEYLRKRGLSDKIIKKFGLGYSPNSWNSLMNYLLSKGYDKTDLVKCGLITHKTESNKYFDRFRNRVMFPIFNYNGKVIGFGGRVLDDSLPKYLNSPETLVFNKRMNLYGLNISKKGIKDDTLILVEGYMDLISLYQNNIENVVATLGTALTIEQAKLIRRFAKNVIISYDSDQAGQNATLRAIDILLKADIKVKENLPYKGVIEITHKLNIPKSANELLLEEIEEVLEFKHRKSQSVDETVELEIKTILTLEKNDKGLKIKSSFNNVANDHRMRMLFATDIESDVHYADSIFELAKRNNIVDGCWENPSNCQHQQAFVNIHNKDYGLTVANKGLNEYELLNDGRNTIAVTLLRCVRELGDWGVFETPDAQCIGYHEAELKIIPHGKNMYDSVKEAHMYQIPVITKQVDMKNGEINHENGLMNFDGYGIIWSTLKMGNDFNTIFRVYNVSDKDTSLEISKCDFGKEIYISNILEEEIKSVIDGKVNLRKSEISTISIR